MRLFRLSASFVVLGLALPSLARSDGPVDFEAKVRIGVALAAPAVVAVGIPSTGGDDAIKPREFASGVLVSEDGLILSQYHVSHKPADGEWGAYRAVGTKTSVVLADGSRVEAELLGADIDLDLSMLGLVKPGKYSFVPLREAPIRLGEPVLKLGHPGGYEPGRPAPSRLGRVVAISDGSFAADCAVDGGDSGGPYLDLDGRLIGIIRCGAASSDVYAAGGAARRRGLMSFDAIPSDVLRRSWDLLRAGKMTGTGTSVRNAAEQVAILIGEDWSQGAKTLARDRELAARAGRGVVEVLDGEDRVALGTVAEAGLILTRASLLPDRPRCRRSGGAAIDAAIVGIDPGPDLALLRVEDEALQPVAWVEADPAVGTLLIAPSPDGVLASGIVSVGARDTGAVAPTVPKRAGRGPAAVPAILGSRVEGRGYWVEFVDGPAAGVVQPGDVIATLGGRPIRDTFDLARAVEGRRAGERISVSLYRQVRPSEVFLTLSGAAQKLDGQAVGLPRAFEHDLPMLVDECGGPVVGLDGRTAGITMARVGPHGCQAIPATAVCRLLPGLKAGRPFATFPETKPVPALRVEGAPNRFTIDDVRDRLATRRSALRSLRIEIVTTTELQVDPRLAASWGFNPPRDLRERIDFAFDGDRRMVEDSRPGMQAFSVPPGEVVPSPDAPSDVASTIRRHRESAQAERAASGVSKYFVGDVRNPYQAREVFDGKDAFGRYGDGDRLKLDPKEFVAYSPYLAGLGLVPGAPMACDPVRHHLERSGLPALLSSARSTQLRPKMESVGGVDCVVLDVITNFNPFDPPNCDVPPGGPARVVDQTLWLDPALGLAPRRWDVHEGDILLLRVNNSQFRELAPGCYLPWEQILESGPPPWVPAPHRNRPVVRMSILVSWGMANSPQDTWFRP